MTEGEQNTIPPIGGNVGRALRGRLRFFQWAVPAGLLAIVIGYELGPAAWLQARFGNTYHQIAEILVYGTIGPIIAFVLLHFLGRWLEERETAELQSYLLEQAREKVESSRQMSDAALQELFAASLQLSTLEGDLPPAAAQRLHAVTQSLDHAVRQMRAALLEHSAGD